MRELLLQKLTLALLALSVNWASVRTATAAVETWTATGAMGFAHSDHTATLLPNGKVLVAGGYGNGGPPSEELYDPATGTWTATDWMSTPRAKHTATLLPNGKVLVTGGYCCNYLSSADLYDPAIGTWTATDSMSTPRGMHATTLLPNGKVLVTGGYGENYLSSAELYDPAIGTWTSTGTMSTVRASCTTTLLPNGKVLVVGGYNGHGFISSAELYDSVTGTWTSTAAMNDVHAEHSATLLPNGTVLVAGGYGDTRADLYDPTTGMWTATGAMNTPRTYHTATLLPNGKVLVTGGDNGDIISSAELYDPAIGAWTSTGEIGSARAYHTASMLPNGKVLVAGGYNHSFDLSSAELYDSGLITVTIAVTEHGEIKGNASPYRPDSTAILTATPDPGYTFAGWTGDATGTTSPVSIPIDSDKTIGANFIPDTNDGDHDGLTNYLEIVIYRTDPNKADTDGDGFLDGYEVLTGKLPLDPLDKPALVAEARTAIEFTFPAALGKTYRIEDSPDLATWTTVETGIAGTGAQIQRFYSTRGQDKRYFRVEEMVP